MSAFDRVSRGFTLLEGKKPSWNSIQTVSIGPGWTPNDIRLGKDSSDNHHLLLLSPESFAQTDPRLGPGFVAQWDSLVAEDGAEYTILDITCLDNRFLSTFRSLIGELLDRVEENRSQGIIELFEVIELWRQTIASAAQKITRSVEVGLFGELYVLLEMAKLRPDDALESWRALDGFRHDFSLTNSVEVKTFTNADNPRVEIHGAKQLDSPPFGALALVAIGVEESLKGQTIEDLIEEISMYLPSQVIRERIRSAHVASFPDLRRFAVMGIRIYDVDDAFPGIRESLLPAHTLLGVEKLTYSLALDVCPPPREIDLSDLLMEL